MRGLGEVEHKDLVGDGSSVRNRQTHLVLFLETFGGNHGVHRHHLRLLVRHFDTYRSLTRHRGDDTDTCRTQRQHDIVLQLLDTRHTYTGFWHDLIERDGRSDGGLNRLNLNTVVTERRHNTCAVRALLLFIDNRCSLVVIDLKQIQTRELKELQVFTRVVRTKFLQQFVRIFGVEFVCHHILDIQIRVLRRFFVRLLHRKRRIAKRFIVFIYHQLRHRFGFLCHRLNRKRHIIGMILCIYRLRFDRNINRNLRVQSRLRWFFLKQACEPNSQLFASVDKTRVGHNKEDNQYHSQNNDRTRCRHITGEPLCRPSAEGTTPAVYAEMRHLLGKAQNDRTPEQPERAATEPLDSLDILEHMHQSKAVHAKETDHQN